MSDLDLSSALRSELRSDRYALDVSSDAVIAALNGRRRRRVHTHRWLVVAAASGSAAALIVAVFVLGSGGGQRSNQPAAPPPAPASASTTKDMDPKDPVAGVPDYLTRSADPAAAMAAEPPLAVRPATGEATAFRPAAAQSKDPVQRVVVVRGPEESVGLLGSPQQPEWAKASSLGGVMALVTDHEPSQTTYLMAFSPTGERWFIAVTAADRTVRMETMRAVAAGTLT
jgi:hypothetical protein